MVFFFNALLAIFSLEHRVSGFLYVYSFFFFVNAPQCEVQLPSGVEKVIDSRCRATIGIVSHPNHGARKLRKAGQSRRLDRGPIVRGVAMNPVDHPHGGGEGRTKGGRPSVSPWGKPTKAGFRAVVGVGKGSSCHDDLYGRAVLHKTVTTHEYCIYVSLVS
ncbi:hypothetical protein ZIOFF_000660 [Zingiber officinale]|uniref:Large ribosomal subunit protein uL2 C-terminal domain-containing protein n=1 Tax=Zingiber officinale TaxID=94328 RepID=A0A8J5M7V0_ZINOF|nr:hypothetical protein ZIOFF_000660 [Zingiber officinale]